MRRAAMAGIFGGTALCVWMACLTAAVGQSGGSAPNGQGAPAQPRPARVKLDGFDLSQSAAKPNASLGGPTRRSGANQIGGASRGIGAVKLLAPEKGLAYSLHPTLQWSGTPGAKYKLHIEDVADLSSFDATVDGTSFTYPETAPALKPGETYSWSVQPEIDIMGGTSDPALFVVVGGAEREAIASALAAIPQTGEAADRARAQVYFDKRVWYDAAEAYSTLIAAHPSDSELHRIRGTLYDQVPATQKLADQDFEMVK